MDKSTEIFLGSFLKIFLAFFFQLFSLLVRTKVLFCFGLSEGREGGRGGMTFCMLSAFFLWRYWWVVVPCIPEAFALSTLLCVAFIGERSSKGLRGSHDLLLLFFDVCSRATFLQKRIFFGSERKYL